MGGDGGTIQKRSDIVRTKGYKMKKDLPIYIPEAGDQIYIGDEVISKQKIRGFLALQCFLSKKPLELPIYIDTNGFIYNSNSIEEFISNQILKNSILDFFSDKRNFKEINYDNYLEVAAFPPFDTKKKNLVCMISGKPFLGNGKLGFSWKCGCVWNCLAAAKLTNIKLDVDDENFPFSNICPVCNTESINIEILSLRNLEKIKSNLQTTQYYNYAPLDEIFALKNIIN